MIGIGQPGLTYFEPTYADELREILFWSFNHLQADDGGSVYLRLSTRKVEQPTRVMSPELSRAVLEGGYWLVPPHSDTTHVIVAMGAIVIEALAAQEQLAAQGSPQAVLVVTSPDRLARGWCATSRQSNKDDDCYLNQLLADAPPGAALVTVLDGHPITLSWLGSASGRRVIPLGVSKFGMSGYLSEVYREHHLDAASIVSAISSDRNRGVGSRQSKLAI
jgi:pyruvate dehydrogenase E1 component